MPEWEIKLSPSLQEMPFDSRARHNLAQIHNATIMYDGFIEQHLVLDIIFPAILLISAQMFIFRVATFVGPSAITNLSLAARLGWLRPKRSGPSPVSHCTTLPSVSDQLGVCATCLYCPLLPGQKCQWIAQRVCCTNQAHDRKSGAVLNRLYILGRVTNS